MAVTEGQIRIEYHDSQSSNPREMLRMSTTEADLSTDFTKQKVVPFYKDVPSLKQDDMLVISLKGITAGTADEGSTIRLPVMRKNTATGIWTQDVLEHTTTAASANEKTFYGFDGQDINVNIAYGVSWTPVWKYTVKAQEEIVLGQPIADNSKAYISLVLTT
jgi:hypothetical protein